MKQQFSRGTFPRWGGIVALLVLAVTTSPRHLGGQSGIAPNSIDKPVEEVFHNIQVFRGLPQSELLPVMHFMRASLGVRCDHCHVAENEMYWKDEKPAKTTARQMIRMVDDINNKNFGGKPVVTCNSCHRGNVIPMGIPSVDQAAFENTTQGAEAAPALPTMETILNNYSLSTGDAALAAVQTRLIRQSVSRPRLVDPQQIPLPLEIYEKAPDKVLVIVRVGQQTVRGAWDGSRSWMEVGDKTRGSTVPERARLRSLLSIYPLGHFKDQYQSLKVIGKEEIGDRVPTFVVEGLTKDNQRQKLYFETKTGLLVRRIAYTRTRLGDDPEQVDLADYRDVGGVKIPFRMTTSYLDNNHLNSVRVISTVENNLALDDARFANPAASR